MAEDLARLGLQVDSGPIRGARQEMGRFAAEGKKTEKAAGGVTKSAAAMSAGMRRASSAIGAAVAGLAALSGSIQVLSSFERQNECGRGRFTRYGRRNGCHALDRRRVG